MRRFGVPGLGNCHHQAECLEHCSVVTGDVASRLLCGMIDKAPAQFRFPPLRRASRPQGWLTEDTLPGRPHTTRGKPRGLPRIQSVGHKGVRSVGS